VENVLLDSTVFSPEMFYRGSCVSSSPFPPCMLATLMYALARFAPSRTLRQLMFLPRQCLCNATRDERAHDEKIRGACQFVARACSSNIYVHHVQTVTSCVYKNLQDYAGVSMRREPQANTPSNFPHDAKRLRW